MRAALRAASSSRQITCQGLALALRARITFDLRTCRASTIRSARLSNCFRPNGFSRAGGGLDSVRQELKARLALQLIAVSIFWQIVKNACNTVRASSLINIFLALLMLACILKQHDFTPVLLVNES